MSEIRKRAAVGALIKNEDGKILIVKPSYKDGWLFVGGMIEQDETPTQALQREIYEEIGLHLDVGKLLCVDFGPKYDESINFVFDCGTIKNDARIFYNDKEIIAHQFVTPEEATTLLRPKGAQRIPLILAALQDGTISYTESNTN